MKAVIYARYSSDNQTEASIEGQLRECMEFAERAEIDVIGNYIDRALTAKTDNRPEFQRMIKDSYKHAFDCIIVWKLDRFARNRYDSAHYKSLLKKNGVKVISAKESIGEGSEGILLESVLEGMAEYYSAELAQKVKRGMNETRLKGNFTGGNIIYGYYVENHKVKVNEEQAEVVRFIYKQYSIGTYVKDIILLLTEKRIFNKGKPFARNTIYNILKNEKYSGIYRFDGQIFNNMYPAIVPNEIYDNVRQKINLNKYGKRSTEVVYLLRHKLKCGYCGMPISAECGTASNGTKRHYYKCLGRKRKNGCKKSMVRKEMFENFIVDNIIKILSSSKYMDKIIDGIMKVQESQSNGNSILNLLLKDKKQAESTLNNIMKAVEQGVVNNTTNKRMKDLENQIEELERQIMIEKSKTILKLSKEDIKEYYIHALQLEPKLLIDYLIQEIKVFEDKIEITFNSPIKTSPDKNQGFFVADLHLNCHNTYKIKQYQTLKKLKLEYMYKIKSWLIYSMVNLT